MIAAYVILIPVSIKKLKNTPSKLEKPKKENCINALYGFIVGIFVVHIGFIILIADVFVQDYRLFFRKKL